MKHSPRLGHRLGRDREPEDFALPELPAAGATSGSRTEFAFAARSGVRDVLLDPDFLVPRWTRALRAEAEATNASTRAYVELLFRQDPASARRTLESALTQVREPDVYASRFLFEALLGTMALQSGDAAAARPHLRAALVQPTRHAEVLPWTYFRLALAERQLGDSIAARCAARDAVVADRIAGRRTGATGVVQVEFPEVAAEGVAPLRDRAESAAH